MELASLEDTLEVLSDPVAVRELAEAREAHARGDYVSGDELRVTGPAQRQLESLPEETAAATVEFMLTALIDNPHRVGGRLQRELARLHSARRGAYRVVYEIDDDKHAVIVLPIDHRAHLCRNR